jgi:hypothetical protein
MLRMPASVMPHFHCDAAYLETPSPPGLDDRHHFSSSVYQELNLVLAASTRCDSVEMQFMHNPAHRNKDVVARLGKALTSILTAAAENPNVQPEQIIYGEPEKQSSGVLVLEEAPEFIF